MRIDLSCHGARLYGSPISLIPGLFYVKNFYMIVFLLRTSSSHEVCALPQFVNFVTILQRVIRICFWIVHMHVIYGNDLFRVLIPCGYRSILSMFEACFDVSCSSQVRPLWMTTLVIVFWVLRHARNKIIF